MMFNNLLLKFFSRENTQIPPLWLGDGGFRWWHVYTLWVVSKIRTAAIMGWLGKKLKGAVTSLISNFEAIKVKGLKRDQRRNVSLKSWFGSRFHREKEFGRDGRCKKMICTLDFANILWMKYAWMLLGKKFVELSHLKKKGFSILFLSQKVFLISRYPFFLTNPFTHERIV